MIHRTLKKGFIVSKLTAIAVAAAVLSSPVAVSVLSASAQGVPQAAPGYDPKAGTMQPGNPDNTRPMSTTPDQREAAAPRERFNQKAEQTLRAWDARIAEYRETANLRGRQEAMEQGATLNEKWIIAKESWQRMNQTAGADWETSKIQFEYAMDALRDAWEQAPPVN